MNYPHPDVIKSLVAGNAKLAFDTTLADHIAGCAQCQQIRATYEAYPDIDINRGEVDSDLLESRGPRFHQVQSG